MKAWMLMRGGPHRLSSEDKQKQRKSTLNTKVVVACTFPNERAHHAPGRGEAIDLLGAQRLRVLDLHLLKIINRRGQRIRIVKYEQPAKDAEELR
jgi:hypothetical protein